MGVAPHKFQESPWALETSDDLRSLMNYKNVTNRHTGIPILDWKPLGQCGEAPWPAKEVPEQIEETRSED